MMTFSRRSKSCCLILILLVIFCLPLFSKPGKVLGYYQFRNLAPQGGFYYDGVTSVFQDTRGFVWVLMANDVFRFDGYEYKRYYARIDGLDISKKWYFTSLEGDALGNIYLSGFNGLFVYDALTDRFRKVFDQHVSFVSIDKRNNVWLQSSVFGRFNPEDGSFQPITFEGNPLSSVSCVQSEDDGLLIGTFQGNVFLFDYRDNETRLLHSLQSKGYIVGIECVGGSLWVLTYGHGLVQFEAGVDEPVRVYNFCDREDGTASPGRIFYWIGKISCG